MSLLLLIPYALFGGLVGTILLVTVQGWWIGVKKSKEKKQLPDVSQPPYRGINFNHLSILGIDKVKPYIRPSKKVK